MESLLSVLCHTLFKTRAGVSIGADIRAATEARGKIQEFLAGRDVFFLHLSELTGT